MTPGCCLFKGLGNMVPDDQLRSVAYLLATDVRGDIVHDGRVIDAGIGQNATALVRP